MVCMKFYPTTRDELANSLTHGIGVFLSIAGLIILILVAAFYGNVWHVVSFSIYGTSLVILYSFSTLYHSVRHPGVKKSLRFLDHSSIYILIAGTYTPFALVSLRGGWGWSLFGVIWACAFVGVLLKYFFTGRYEILSVIVYIAMGWLCLIALKEITVRVPGMSIILLLSGGVSYTAGVVFYAWKKVPYHHAIWHVFVFTGSLFHYFAVLALVNTV